MERAIIVMIRSIRLNNICTDFYFPSFKFDWLKGAVGGCYFLSG